MGTIVLHHIMIRGIDRRKIFINGRIGMNMLEGLAGNPNGLLLRDIHPDHQIEANALFSKNQKSVTKIK